MKLFFKGWKRAFLGLGSFLGIFAAVVTLVHQATQSGSTPAPGHVVLSTALAIIAGVGVGCIGGVVVVHSVQKVQGCFADSRHLRQLRTSLPILFQKTEHLRDYLSRQNVDAALARLKNAIGQLSAEELDEYGVLSSTAAVDQLRKDRDGESPATAASVSALVRSFPDADPRFSTPGARLILEDLRKSFDHVYPGKQTSCMILLLTDDPHDAEGITDNVTNIPLMQCVEKRLSDTRSRGEEPYLRNGASLGAYVLSQREALHFGQLREVVKWHRLADWCDPRDAENVMGAHVQSGELWPIIVNGKPTSVLQVDSPHKNAFGPEATHMVKCAADCLGILLESYNTLTESYCQGMLLERQCEEYERTIGTLHKDCADLSAELALLRKKNGQPQQTNVAKQTDIVDAPHESEKDEVPK